MLCTHTATLAEKSVETFLGQHETGKAIHGSEAQVILVVWSLQILGMQSCSLCVLSLFGIHSRAVESFWPNWG